MTKEVSRRDFLKLAGLGLGSLALLRKSVLGAEASSGQREVEATPVNGDWRVNIARSLGSDFSVSGEALWYKSKKSGVESVVFVAGKEDEIAYINVGPQIESKDRPAVIAMKKDDMKVIGSWLVGVENHEQKVFSFDNVGAYWGHRLMANGVAGYEQAGSQKKVIVYDQRKENLGQKIYSGWAVDLKTNELEYVGFTDPK